MYNVIHYGSKHHLCRAQELDYPFLSITRICYSLAQSSSKWPSYNTAAYIYNKQHVSACLYGQDVHFMECRSLCPRTRKPPKAHRKSRRTRQPSANFLNPLPQNPHCYRRRDQSVNLIRKIPTSAAG